MKICEVVLSGGLGTRLGENLSRAPKILLPVLNEYLLLIPT